MASKPITLLVRPRGTYLPLPKPLPLQIKAQLTRHAGKPITSLPEEIVTSSSDTASELYQKLAAVSKFSINRLRITKGSDGVHVPNNRDIVMQQTGLRDRSTIYVKDLGQ